MSATYVGPLVFESRSQEYQSSQLQQTPSRIAFESISIDLHFITQPTVQPTTNSIESTRPSIVPFTLSIKATTIDTYHHPF